ncbi:MAG: hypothetical protein Kow00128_17550 [Deltaproteobacteria bacterium]
MWPERFGNYFVVRKIASGGMSEVYLCRLRGEEGFEKTAAVKVIHPRLSSGAPFRELFVREARIAAALSHPNLVQVFDFGRAGDSLYLAMEYVPGWNLAQVAARIRSRTASLPLEIWRAWTEGIVEGLGYLHSRKVLHRDISPGNVLLSRSGAVKLADFGIALPAADLRRSGVGWEGKASYLSPERARGEEGGVRSDLFSAAVVAAELFLPARLFDGPDEEAILSRIGSHSTASIPCDRFPPAAAGLLRRALHPRPEGRFPDAAAFSRAIAEAVPSFPSRGCIAAFFDDLFPEQSAEEDTVVVAPVGPPAGGGLVREDRGRYGPVRTRRMGVAIAAVVAAASLGTFLWSGRSRDPSTEPSAPAVRGSSASSSSGRPAREPVAAERNLRPPVRKTANRPPPPEAVSAKPAGGILLITVPEGVAVLREDGIRLGRTPLRIEGPLRDGESFLLRHEGYRDRRLPAAALSGRSEFRLEMEPRTGTIPVVQAIPWAKVFDGDRLLGVTPIRSLRLPVGAHTLRFVNEALGVDRIETVEVREEGNGKLVVPLIRREEAPPPR